MVEASDFIDASLDLIANVPCVVLIVDHKPHASEDVVILLLHLVAYAAAEGVKSSNLHLDVHLVKTNEAKGNTEKTCEECEKVCV